MYTFKALSRAGRLGSVLLWGSLFLLPFHNLHGDSATAKLPEGDQASSRSYGQVAPGLIRLAPALRAPEDHYATNTRVLPLGPFWGKVGVQRSIVLPALSAGARENLRKEDAQREAGLPKGRLRIGIGRAFGQPTTVNQRTTPAAEWVVLPDGWRIWSAQVTSPGALGIRVHLESLSLPEGARLVVYDPATLASETAPIMAGSVADERAAWAQTVFAERVVVECQVPPGLDPSRVEFALTGVSHLYRSFGSGLERDATAPCENDVTCYPTWASQAAGVALINFVDQGNSYACSGCLLNTSPSTLTNYFLTANHCVGDQTTASTLECYWFYQTSTCNGTPPALTNVPSTSGGADFLAGVSRDSGSDFAFLRLHQSPPGGVYYVGWSVGAPVASETLTGIHHPQGDYTRISFGNLSSTDTNYWDVQWYSGQVEPGSSGSPLFNANQQVIGQLWGGTPIDCSGLSQVAEYGRFDVTFSYIQQWLEPTVLNPGCTTLPPPAPSPGVCGATNASTTPTLSWTAVGGAHGYLVQVFSGNACGQTPIETSPLLSPAATTWTVPASAGLQNGLSYSWQVQAKGDGTATCDSSWSDCCAFSIANLPPFVPVKGTYSGLFEDTVDGISPQNSGLFTMSTMSSGKFSASLQVGGGRYSLIGTLDSNGQAAGTISRRNQTPLAVSLQMNGINSLTGVVSNSAWVAQLSANLAGFDGRTNLAPQRGTYTMYLTGDYGATADPAGDSWGTLRVDAAGNVFLSASLADGTRITESTTISTNGQWPLYASLSNGQGAILGWMTFGYSPTDDLGADAVSWIKPRTSSKVYPSGFTTLTSARGSRYSAPALGANVLALTNAELVLNGGNLPQSIPDSILLGARNRVSDLSSNKLSVIFSLPTGTFSGRLTEPGTSKILSFSGVLLPSYGLGRGYFLGPNQSGEVQLSPPASATGHTGAAD